MSASTTTPRRIPAARSEAAAKKTAASAPAVPWYRQTWFLAFSSSVLLWLALSPLGLWPLAWVAPLGWLLLIRQEKMSGWRPYVVLWGAGLVHWLLVLEGVRLAYWALYLGWFALAAYLACYLPLFVGLARWAVHRARVPLLIAAPLIWVGLELFRGYFLTGFSLGLLAHSQTPFTLLLQVADAGGAYAVSFVMLLAAAGIAQALPWEGARWNYRPLVALTLVMAMTLGYGVWRMQEATPGAQREPLRVALLQGSVDTIFGVPATHFAETCRTYQQQAVAIAKAHPELDLLIWPESAFMSVFPECLIDDDATLPTDAPGDIEQFRQMIAANQDNFHQHTTSTARAINGITTAGEARSNIAQIVGTATYHCKHEAMGRYNSALLVSPAGEVQGRYYKTHRVMFGEYIPGGDWFPWIYRLTPMAEGLTAGERPAVFNVAGHRLAPNICFESTVPQLVRRQLHELAALDQEADMLVNVTNDGWFWGSGILDLHYNCAVFRAIEHRKPMLVAANTGFSVAVDGRGQVLTKGPRRAASNDLIVDVRPDGRRTLYSQWGDWSWLVVLSACGIVMIYRARTLDVTH